MSTTKKREQWRRWYVRNREARRKYMAAWRAANPDSVRAQNKKGWDAYKLRNPERARSQQRAWVLANPDSVRASREQWKRNNKDKLRVYAAAWKKARRAYYTAVQNARRVGTSGWDSLTPKEKKRIEDVYEMCAILSAWTGIPHHVDHKKPISRGGKHRLRNLQIMPSAMNLRKSNK